jgi:hypothetical protein
MTLLIEDFMRVPLPAANTIADFISIPPSLFYQKIG